MYVQSKFFALKDDYKNIFDIFLHADFNHRSNNCLTLTSPNSQKPTFLEVITDFCLTQNIVVRMHEGNNNLDLLFVD